MARAKRGGEVGVNGEYYPGGTFLPTTTLGKMPKRAKKTGTGKQEIAPYQWEVAPQEGLRSLYRMLAGTYAIYNRDTEKLEPFLPFIEYQERTFPQFNRAEILSLIEKWNNGERWI